MFQTATAFSSRLSTSTRSKRSLSGDPGFEGGAFQDALELRNGVVDHRLADRLRRERDRPLDPATETFDLIELPSPDAAVRQLLGRLG